MGITNTGDLGPIARTAVPALRRLVGDKAIAFKGYGPLGDEAVNALRKIDPDALKDADRP